MNLKLTCPAVKADHNGPFKGAKNIVFKNGVAFVIGASAEQFENMKALMRQYEVTVEVVNDAGMAEAGRARSEVQPPAGGPEAPGPGAAGAAGGAEGGSGDANGGGSPNRAPNLKMSVMSLDPKNDTHWTKGGLPSLEHLSSELPGVKVTRAAVEEVAPGFNREKAAEAVSAIDPFA